MAPRPLPVYASPVRRYLLAGCLALIVPAVELTAPHAEAQPRGDFDPTGRGRKPKPPKGPGVVKPGTGPAKPPKPKDEEGKGGPGSDALIARYTGIVLQQPAAPFPIQRLAQLYRERDGNLKKLIEDFEQRTTAAGTDTWSARVALAGIYKQDGRYDDAIKTYQAAITEKPKEPTAIMALGQLESDRGDKAAARKHFEQALPLLKVNQDIEQTTRTLMTLCLDLKDFDGAKKQHDALVKTAPGSLFVKAELGRELLGRGNYDRAEAEFRDLVKAASGDNRALAPALRDLGQALAKQKKMDEALTTLKRALAIAGSAAGVRSEILLIITDAFRAEGKLPELIVILEAEKGQDFQRLATMGALYEETGDVEKALATYRKALAIDGKHIDVRLKLVHLLQTAGELDTAIKEYEALIKAAPNNPDFVFELAETLIQRGDRPKALKLVTELEGRVTQEAEILAAIADFYERVEEKEKALKVLQKLAAAGGGDPTHIIDLGDRYFQAGDKKRALETWARIKTMVPSRSKAAATLGEVYLDHDMPVEALASLREASQLEPANVRYKKALAIALERTATSLGNPASRYNEARAIWEDLLKNTNDKLVAREARTHIVSLWSLTRQLPGQVAPLQGRFALTPPDLEAGRLLAEVQRKLNRLPDAEATLRKITGLAPGDEESFLALERVLVLQQNLNGAIDVLAKLVEVNPKRAREYYQRMAQYAAELYHDDDAIKYAARAVELSPEDANGHQKLGEMYRRRQDNDKAIAEYRQAISKNDRLFPVYFDLAELLLSSGQVDEADRLFRRVVRAANDEELVTRAARMSMQINLGKNSLDTLERELLPAAVGNPQKPIYRRLLVELYGAMTFPLVQKVRHGGKRGAPGAAAAAAGRAELAKIGTRAVKPLLDALVDDKESQQKIAIEVLAYVENRSAGPALYNFAIGQADKALRVRAMVACGALRDPALLTRYEQMLAPKEGSSTILPSDSIAVAAAWGVARMGDKKAEPLLVKLLSSAAPDVRAVAAIGLGLTRDKKHVPALIALARSPETGSTARAAALYALGELSAGSASAGETTALLLGVADSNELLLRQSALLNLARLAPGESKTNAGRTAADAIAAGVFAQDPSLRADASLAAVAFATKSYKRSREALPVPDGPLTLRDVLQGLGPDPYEAGDRAAALIALGPALQKAAVAAVSTSPDRARAVADALLMQENGVGIAPFTDAEGKLPAGVTKDVESAVEGIAAAVVPGFVALVRHPEVEVRTRAVELLARRPEPEAQAAVVDALGDPEESVRRAALSAVGPVKHQPTIQAVAKVARESKSWPLRVRATEALGRLGAGAPSPLVIETLTAAARTDAYALVRESAARAVYPLDKVAGAVLLRDLAANDAEPRVKATAAELLKSGGL